MQVIIDGIEYMPRSLPYGGTVGQAVASRRHRLGMTHKVAAAKCGVHPATLFAVENDQRALRFDTIARIALGLGLDISRLAETVLKNP